MNEFFFSFWGDTLTFHTFLLCFIDDEHVILKLSDKEVVELSDLQRKWKNLCIPMEQLNSILSLDDFSDGVDWMKFFALACSVLGGVGNLVKPLM